MKSSLNNNNSVVIHTRNKKDVLLTAKRIYFRIIESIEKTVFDRNTKK